MNTGAATLCWEYPLYTTLTYFDNLLFLISNCIFPTLHSMLSACDYPTALSSLANDEARNSDGLNGQVVLTRGEGPHTLPTVPHKDLIFGTRNVAPRNF